MQTLSSFIPLGAEALRDFFLAANDVVFRDSRAARVERLSPEARHLYLAYVYNAEVLNGGVSQFFSNTSGDWVEETLEALRVLQAAPYLALLEEACDAVFGCTSPPRNQLARHELLEAYEAQQPDALSELDGRHYVLLRTESIEASMQRYLSSHSHAPLEVARIS